MSVPPVVEAWSTYRTGSAAQWTPRQLVRAKKGTGISVVIPARDEETTLPTLLDSLRRLTVEVCDIVVVDDGSRDATAAVAGSAGAFVCIISLLPMRRTGGGVSGAERRSLPPDLKS